MNTAELRVQALIQTTLNMDNQDNLSLLARESVEQAMHTAVIADYFILETLFHEGDLTGNFALQKHLHDHPNGLFATLLREMEAVKALPDIDVLGTQV